MGENTQKEMNLLELTASFFNWLKKVFINLFKLAGNTLRLLYRHKVITIIILILSAVLGYFLSHPRIYKAEAMVIVNGTTAQSVKSASQQIEATTHLYDNATLSARLSLPDDVTKNIKRIESFYVIDYLRDSVADAVDFKNKHKLTDTLNVRMPNRLYFRIRTANPGELPIFEKAFINYFNTNPLLVKEFEVGKANLERKIKLVDSEIQRIDSMATLSYLKNSDQQVQMVWNRLLVGEKKKQLLYNDLLNLQSKKIYLDNEYISFTEPIVIPNGFVFNPVPENGRMKYIAIGLLIGFCISILLSLFIENFKCIHSYLSKK